MLLSIVTIPVFFVMLFSLGSHQIRDLLDGLSFLNIIMLLTIFIPIALFIKTWVDAAIVWAIVAPKDQVSVLNAYRSSMSKVIPYWWASLLLSLVTIGGILPLGIPGIIFATWFGFAPILTVTDRLRGFAALQTSKIFIRGKVLAVLSRQLFLGMLSLIIAAPVWIGWRLAFGAEGAKETVEFLAFLISPFSIAYQFAILKSLRERPEVQAAREVRQSSWPLVILTLWGIIAPLLIFAFTFYSLVRLYRDFSAPFI